MRAFSFKLKTLLHIRGIEKDKALRLYAQAIGEKERIKFLLSAKKKFLKNLKSEVGKRRLLNFSGFQEETFQRSIEKTNNQILQIHGELENSKSIENAKREIYLKADSNFKSLENLKDKKHEEHVNSELKKEESELEDIIGSRFIYNHKPSHSS